MDIQNLLPLVVILPFIGATLIGLLGFLSPNFRKQESLIGVLATTMVAIPFVIYLISFLSFDGKPLIFDLFSWMETPDLKIRFSYELDQLSLLMGMIVTGVGSLIHLYSMSYMHGDSGYYKYFLYLNLFIFAMTNLILGDNLVVLFLGWEGVGACSYFLIGYWFNDMEKAKAAQKAFVANRIGDFALLTAMFLIYSTTGTLTFREFVYTGFDPTTLKWICLLVFIAATGKSAQIPLYVWLPDAMAGPTPVSALIHAATMVTSGIYLIARMSWMFYNAHEVLVFIAIIGALTAVSAAMTAIAQNDIKKVLAYSTVSQLGFMFMALGTGAFTTAIFHVMTHAFFKACLFLGSGSVIHAMDHAHAAPDPQDIRFMGNLKKYMPHTSKTFFISVLAIAGIPPLSGFFSKDEILGKAFAAGHENAIYYLVWFIGVCTAFMTAFYMTRLYVLTFEGKERFQYQNNHEEHHKITDAKAVDTHHGHDNDHHHHEPHESPAIVTIPLWILAILAIVGGFVGLPEIIGHGHFNWISHHWLGAEGTPLVKNISHHASLITEIFLIVLSIAIGVIGVSLAWKLYIHQGLQGDQVVKNKLGSFYKVLENKFYVDEFYNAVIVRPFVFISDRFVMFLDKEIVDGAVNGAGELTDTIGGIIKKLQSGFVQNYAIIMVSGVIIILAYLLI